MIDKMNNKIPCGGFYLSDTLGVDENGKLGVNGGEPYKSLVTDGNGNTKWEDRLAYDDSKLVIDTGHGAQFIKVADEVPSWASVDASTKVWISGGNNYTVPPEGYIDLGNGSFVVGDFVFFITTDNVEFNGKVFPKKGVYFVKTPSAYVTGIARADSDTPEITWDGNIGTLKTIDEKFIPDIPAEKLPDMPDVSCIFKATYKETTFAEITEAYTSGKNVVVENNGFIYTLCNKTDTEAHFVSTSYWSRDIKVLLVNSNNVWYGPTDAGIVFKAGSNKITGRIDIVKNGQLRLTSPSGHIYAIEVDDDGNITTKGYAS